MTELWDTISTWSVLKWIILVLIAGFIGQFGRMTAEAVTAQVRRRREKRKVLEEKPILPVEPPDEAPEDTPPGEATTVTKDKKTLKTSGKIRKKDAKAAGKASKK